MKAIRTFYEWAFFGVVGLMIGLGYEQPMTPKSPEVAMASIVNCEKPEDKHISVEGYIKRFAKTAQQEQEKFNIPASITLAQGILESRHGNSRLVKQNKNHFGIKCFAKSCSKGHCSNFNDDTHKDFFMKYNNDWESFRAHSLFLQKKRYRHLTSFNDFEIWAYGLKESGYATDTKYPTKLISIIEKYNLTKYDRQ